MKSFMNLSVIVAILLFVWGCNRSANLGPAEDISQDKSPYYIQVSSIADIKKPLQLKKAGTLIGASNLIISAQVPGRVYKIPVNLWSQVRKGDILVQLQDYMGNYSINASRASNAIQWAKINYQTTLTSFEKQEQDARLALDDAKFKLNKVQSDVQAQEAKIKLDLENANLNHSWSTANLQLQQLSLQIEKWRIDLEAKKISDRQTTENFINTYQVLVRDLNLLYENVIDEADKILWSRIQTQNLNDAFESYLWVKNTTSKLNAENQMLQVINYQNTYKSLLDQQVTIEWLSSHLKSLLEWLKKLNSLLSAINMMLINSVSSTVFSQAQIDGMIASINGLQAQVQSQMSSITSQQNAIQSFLTTYQSQQDSMSKSFEALQQQYENTHKSLNDGEILTNLASQRQKIALEQNVKGAELGLQQATNLNAILSKQKASNLASISNSVSSAQIGYQDAANQLDKFRIISPIDGIVADILVDLWQDVWVGTPLLRVYNNVKPQIEITLGRDEILMVRQWSPVLVTIWSQVVTWTISSIGAVSDSNFMTKAIIDIPQTVTNLWDIVDIVIPVESDIVLIPLNVITLLNSQLGQLTLRDGSWTIVQEVKMGKVYGDLVSLETPLSDKTYIITSSLDTYNPVEQILVVKK